MQGVDRGRAGHSVSVLLFHHAVLPLGLLYDRSPTGTTVCHDRFDDDESLAEILKSGVVLCDFANRLQVHAVPANPSSNVLAGYRTCAR